MAPRSRRDVVRMSSPPAPWSPARAPRGARCCWCTGRSTTTGPSPRASRIPASTSPQRRCARCSRRPASRSGSGCPLRPQLYAVSGGRAKKVHYWVGHVVGDDDVSAYEINDEVDDLGWFALDAAKERLTYLDDIDLLEQFRPVRKNTARPGRRTPCQGAQARRLGRARPRAAARRRRARSRPDALSRSCTRSASPGCSAPRAPAASRPSSPTPTSRCCPSRRSTSSPRRASHEAAAAAAARPADGRSRQPACCAATGRCCPALRAPRRRPRSRCQPAEMVVCHHRKRQVVATERHHPL